MQVLLFILRWWEFGIRINDAFIVSERETPLLSADNIVFNGSGEEIEFNDVGQSHSGDGVFDVDLHNDDAVVKWMDIRYTSTLGNNWDSSLGVGYHQVGK